MDPELEILSDVCEKLIQFELMELEKDELSDSPGMKLVTEEDNSLDKELESDVDDNPLAKDEFDEIGISDFENEEVGQTEEYSLDNDELGDWGPDEMTLEDPEELEPNSELVKEEVLEGSDEILEDSCDEILELVDEEEVAVNVGVSRIATTSVAPDGYG